MSRSVARIITDINETYRLLKTFAPDAGRIRIALANNNVSHKCFCDILDYGDDPVTNLAEVLCCHTDKINEDQKRSIIQDLSRRDIPYAGSHTLLLN